MSTLNSLRAGRPNGNSFVRFELNPRPILREAYSMTKFIASAKKFIESEDAPSMVEYGLLVGLVAMVIAVAAKTLGSSISSLFNTTSSSV